MIEGLTESEVLENKEKWSNLTQKTRAFFREKMPALTSRAQNEYESKGLSFIPVAPYGRDADTTNIDTVKHGFLVGLPLLHILKSDGII
jgi:hypothetical protein